jgi:dGTPase
MIPRLDALRFPAALSRGRRHPEPPHPYRSEFQRDRDRIVHARAFRRLEDKTQVFTAGISDHFRNRLTHTIEVSQIARTVACALGLNEDLTEALALAHDIGHPPFGHSGEEALDRSMRAFGDCFDHNLHALRIVERFEHRYAQFKGLNLTFEVREGIVKHSRELAPGGAPELDEYLPGLRPPLEAQLIDLADETAYNTADLDDGFSAGLFAAEELSAQVPQYARIHEEVTRQFPHASAGAQFIETLRPLIDTLVSGLIEGTYESSLTSGAKSVDDIRRHPTRLASFTSEARQTSVALKRFLRGHVYFSNPLVAERSRSAAAVEEMFALFVKNPDRLPEGYLEETHGQPVHRVVCDYIAGMTDGFFWRVYDSCFSGDTPP